MGEFSNVLVKYLIYGYLAVSVLYLCAAVFRSRAAGTAASGLTWLCLAAHSAAITLRWIGSYHIPGAGHAPFSNMFESLVFFGWTLTLIYLILEWRTGWRLVGAFAMPLAFFSLLYASQHNAQISPLVPALKSNWLIAHVISCFLGYAAFGVSAALSLMYISTGQERNPEGGRAQTMDELIYRNVVVGFIMLTAGIITGAVWADQAWGRYWGWDPKEIWSLVTWLVYGAFLHSRFMRGWRGRRLAFFSLLGFACVLFTYFGVNWIVKVFEIKGLHNY